MEIKKKTWKLIKRNKKKKKTGKNVSLENKGNV